MDAAVGMSMSIDEHEEMTSERGVKSMSMRIHGRDEMKSERGVKSMSMKMSVGEE